jgi:hypothetical protein
MKKVLMALAVAGLSYGAVAQPKPAEKHKKEAATAVKPAKADTTKAAKTVKKVAKKKKG